MIEEKNIDIFEEIKNKRESFSKSFNKIADFVCINYEEVPFMTASEIAKRVGVNKSVVVRFASALGYSGFVEMKKNLQKHVRNKLRMPDRMLAVALSSESDYQDILSTVFNKDVENMISTLKNPYNKAFEQIVKDIKKASRVYIIGNRGLYRVAELTAFLFDLAGIDCISINAMESSSYQRLRNIKKQSVLLAFSFPRYDSHINEALKYAKKSKAKIIVISDSPFSPDAKIADETLNICVQSNTFINSYCAIISMINSIITAIGTKYKDDTMNSLYIIEKCLEGFENNESYLEFYE